MGKRIPIEKAIRILREVEVLQSQGMTIGEACRKVNVSEHTYYRWKKEYGRLHVDQAKRLIALKRAALGQLDVAATGRRKYQPRGAAVGRQDKLDRDVTVYYNVIQEV